MKNTRVPSLTVLAVTLMTAATASAQYNEAAGQNAPTAKKTIEVRDERGRVVETRTVEVAPEQDRFGNAQGNQFDLARDGAFEGQTVAVIQLCTEFDFSLPKAALKEKGFGVYRWFAQAPSAKELEEALKKSTQLWVVSGTSRQLTDEHVKIIKKFFDAGHGVYIWGDNDPYYADANVLAQALLGSSMSGNLPGNVTVSLKTKESKSGLLPNHLLTTGIQNLFEGITIATIEPSQDLKPLLYGSAGNLVTAIYEKDGKRAILDGGFTRLYCSWDTAGSARYVKNAAAWLANVERFGDGLSASKTAPTGKDSRRPLRSTL